MRVLNTPASSEAAASSDATSEISLDDRHDIATHMVEDKHRVGWPRLLPLECRGQSKFKDLMPQLCSTGQIDEIIPNWNDMCDATAHIMWRHSVEICKIEYGEQVIQGPRRLEWIPIFRVVADGWFVKVADWREALFELATALVELGLDCGSTPLHVEIVHRHMPYSWCMDW